MAIYEQTTEGPTTRSNWPDTAGIPDRPDKQLFAVDVDGQTRLSTEDLKEAVELAHALQSMGKRPIIRPFTLREEDLQEENAKKRERLDIERVYKPTPARTMHYR